MNIDTKTVVSPGSPPRESVILNIRPEDISRSSSLCCGRQTDPRMLSFSVKVAISLMVLGFSMYKLYKQAPCDCADDSVVYVSLITSILSVWTGASLAR
jgi:hypothetical protein